jgi:hypothetical protein
MGKIVNSHRESGGPVSTWRTGNVQAHHRRGVDAGAGVASQHGAGLVWRTGAGLCAAISEGEVFYLVAGTLSGQPDYGRTGDFGQDARSQKPGGGDVAAGRTAQALWQSKTYLGDCFRRWKARLGTPKAITAMAHKLARILWHLLKYREVYNPQAWAAAEEKLQAKKLELFGGLHQRCHQHHFAAL